ncbi:hypothetical protein [Pimelobacter simplex]|uniref:hypothetical protein n=1 Tax=Nocardioides simplex TaxID=2045 RepID=UPI0019345ACB|nr:hypothetical protein [Pimelobacter simplex]
MTGAATGGAHVWVVKPTVPIPWPGLILDRRRLPDGSWEALVTYIERMTINQKVITTWVPYDWLRKGAQRPAGGTAYG